MTGNELRQLLIGRSQKVISAWTPAGAGNPQVGHLPIEHEEFEDLVIEDLHINTVVFNHCSFSNVRFVRCTLNDVKFLDCSLITQTPLLEQCIGADAQIEMKREYPVLAPLMHKCLLANTRVRANPKRIRVDDYIASDSMLPAMKWLAQNRSFRFSRTYAPDVGVSVAGDFRFLNGGDGVAEGLEPAPSLHNIIGIRSYDRYQGKSASNLELLESLFKYALRDMYQSIEELSLAGKWSSISSDDPMKLDPDMCADFLMKKVAKTTQEYKLLPPHMREVDFVRAVVSVLVQQLVMYQSICLGAGK